MEKVECENYEDELIAGLTNLQFASVVHAAAISPFVKCRTIGNDLKGNVDPEVINTKEVLEKKFPNSEKNAISTQANRYPLTNVNIVVPDRSKDIDFYTIDTRTQLREAERQRKLLLSKSVKSFQENKLSEEKQFVEKRLAKEKPENRIAKNQRLLEQRLKEAEEMVAREEQEKKRELEVTRLKTENQLKTITCQGVLECQNNFRMKYQTIAQILMTIDSEKWINCGDFNQQIKDLMLKFEELLSKMKNDECGINELKTANNLYKSLVALEMLILSELGKAAQEQEQQKALEAVKQKEAAKQKLQEELQEKQQQQQQLQLQLQQQELEREKQEKTSENCMPAEAEILSQPINAEPEMETSSATTVSQSVYKPQSPLSGIPAAERFYNQIMKFYQDKLDNIKSLQSDDGYKKFRSACQKAINIPVNAISAVSPQHLQDKFEKLYSFLSGQAQKTTDGQISINQHPQGRDYCLLLMAKKFVGQGDTAISSNPQAAFPVASVIVTLWKLIPEFGFIFLAYTYKESPFLVPYYIPKKPEQTIEDYLKVLGYRSVDGQSEQQEQYLKRQAGIARLYFAVLIAEGRTHEAAISHPFGLDQGWRWVATFSSLYPLQDICATLLSEFLQTTGAEMWQTYGKQFVKLLFFLQQHYLPKLAAVDQGGPRARLELLLGKYIREGQIQKPAGELPKRFW